MFHHNSIGLDISDFSIKICKLSKKRGGIFIDNFKTIKAPIGYIENGRIIQKEQTAELLKQIVKNTVGYKRGSTLINTALPEQATFVMLLTVNKDTETKNHDLINNIKTELSHHIPYQLDDIYIDWQEVSAFDKGRKKKILVGGCPKNIVEEYIDVIYKANCIPVSLEIESLPIIRSICKLHQTESVPLSNKSIIVIDLGEARSSLIFWNEQKYTKTNVIEFAVNIALSGKKINNLIAQKLKLTQEEAEKFKIKYGLEKKGSRKNVIEELIKPLLDEFISRINQALDFHNTHFDGTGIDKIILCGGGANLKGLDQFLSTKLRIPVEYGNPLINIKNNNCISKDKALSYATAIGLALGSYLSRTL